MPSNITYTAGKLLEHLRELETKGAPLDEMPIAVDLGTDVSMGPWVIEWRTFEPTETTGPDVEHYFFLKRM